MVDSASLSTFGEKAGGGELFVAQAFVLGVLLAYVLPSRIVLCCAVPFPTVCLVVYS